MNITNMSITNINSQEINLENLSNKDLLDYLKKSLLDNVSFNSRTLGFPENKKLIIISIIEERMKDLVSSNEKLIFENNNLKQNINKENENNLNQKNVLEDEIFKLKNIISYILNLEKNKKRKLENI